MQIRSTDPVPSTRNPVSVLLVSGHLSDRTELQRILAWPHWKLQIRVTCGEAMSLLPRKLIQVVICDHETAHDDWRWLLGEMAGMAAPPRLIVSSRLADERLWAEVLNLGGYDVLSTPFVTGEVLRACSLAWQDWLQASPVATLRTAAVY